MMMQSDKNSGDNHAQEKNPGHYQTCTVYLSLVILTVTHNILRKLRNGGFTEGSRRLMIGRFMSTVRETSTWPILSLGLQNIVNQYSEEMGAFLHIFK